MSSRAVSVLLLLWTAGAALAGTSKPPPVSVRLLGEGNEKEGDSFVMPIDLTMPPKRIFVRRLPIVTDKDFRAFFTFPGKDGTIGAYFQLDADGSNRLQQFTTEDRGQLGVFMINGRVVGAVRIENPVKDGILYLPGGLLPSEVIILGNHYPIIGREAEFGKKPPKSAKPKPTPAQ